MLEGLLSIFFVAILVTGALAALGQFWHWLYWAQTGQNETSYAIAPDGWRLAVHRYRPTTTCRGLPVILCHGLFANRYIFDLPGGPSLARFLSGNGWDVWVAELRGAGMSDRPGLFRSDVPCSWNFEDHLRKDVPTIVSHVLDRTGASAVHWVGHSMGGMLVQAYLATNENPRVASAIAVGSPVNFSQMRSNAFETLLRVKRFLTWSPVSPLPLVARVLTPLAHPLWSRIPGPFRASNIAPVCARKALALGAQPVSPSALWLDFGRYLETGIFGAGDGRNYLEKFAACKARLLLLAGSEDWMAPEASVRGGIEGSIPCGELQVATFGKAAGCRDEYGHIDLLVGKNVETEVFPYILRWLENHNP